MSLVTQAIDQELRELLPRSKFYAEEAKNAKTTVKRKLMEKRLKRNNEKISNLLIAQQRIHKKYENNATRGAFQESPANEPTE